MKYDIIIGLEVHIQLTTNSKLFSGSATTFGNEPNSQASIIDLGFPGVLPVLNETAVNLAIKFGLSINANIAKKSIFARKNYFYPDLSKGYQITQHDFPLIKNGFVNINLGNDTVKKIRITKAHLEEDSGKMLHDDFQGLSAIDFNRAGISLLEVVSEPDMRSSKEAVTYLKTLHNLIRYLEISDGNMQEGAFRCDVNVSVKPIGQNKFGTRTEIKNLNSFRYVEKAIDYEANRQIEIIKNGGNILRETRLYDANKNETRSLRIKEESVDYRYFPDPDLLPLVITEQKIAAIKKNLPEMPWEKFSRFKKQYNLNSYNAKILTDSRDLADYFELTIKQSTAPPELIANWIITEFLALFNKKNATILTRLITTKQMAELTNRIHDNTISRKIAKDIFISICDGEEYGSVDEIIKKQDLQQIRDNNEIEKIIDQIIINNPKLVNDYLFGKTAIFTFFVGLVMKATKGKAAPKLVNELLNLKLREIKL